MAGREHDWIRRADHEGARLARIQRRDALAGGLAGGLTTAVTGLTAAAVAVVAIPAVRDGRLAGVLLAAVILLSHGGLRGGAPAGHGRREHRRAAPAPRSASRTCSMRRRPWPIPPRPWTCRWTAPSNCAACAFATATSAHGARRRRPAPRSRPGGGPPRPQRLRQDDARRAAGALPRSRRRGRRARRDRRCAARPRTTCARPSASARRTRTCSPARWPRTWCWRGPARRRPSSSAPWRGSGSGRGSRRCPTAWRRGRRAWREGLRGQRRRIAAARLLLSPARFLIADEPAAHLDAERAAALVSELAREARAGRGVLVIAHEPYGLECFDKVFTLRAGRLD